MKNNLRIAILFTAVTTVVFGIVYPLAVTGLAQILFPSQANGSLISRKGHWLGQSSSANSFLVQTIFIPDRRTQEPGTTLHNPRVPTYRQRTTCYWIE
jgi:K+-transporting ATPase c subunit